MSTGCGSTAPPAPRDAGASSTVQQEEFTLDRAAFTRTLRVVALRLPTKLCNAAVKQLQNHVLRLRHVKAILKSDDGNDERRVVLLATEVEEGKTGDDITLADLPAPVKAFVEAAKVRTFGMYVIVCRQIVVPKWDLLFNFLNYASFTA